MLLIKKQTKVVSEVNMALQIQYKIGDENLQLCSKQGNENALILEPWGVNEITSDENVVPGAGIYFW